MDPGIKRLIKKLLFLTVPFVVYGVVVLVVDPYNFFGWSKAVSDELKLETSAKVNSTLWRIPAYLENPTPGVLLGDSRMMSMPEDTITQRTGVEFTNLAYGGGTLREAIDTFWLIADRTELKQVYIGINFNLYSANNSRNRVLEVTSALHNPLLYFTNLNVIHATRLILADRFFSAKHTVGAPQMSPEAFWERQLNVTTRLFYQNYRYSAEFLQDLTEIAAYCSGHGVELAFVIFPSHVDLQEQVGIYHLEDAYERYKADLAGITRVYDFDYRNPFTQDRSNFKDPYHVTAQAEHEILEGVWGGGSSHVQMLGDV